jgi:putative phosphoesterase
VKRFDHSGGVLALPSRRRYGIASRVTRIGLISDTHGLLRPEAVAFLHGSDRIIHAGDIGSVDVLAALSALAPLTAVRGNNDTGAWADAVPETDFVRVGGVAIGVVHDIADLGPDVAGVHAVIAGHSHRPLVEQRGDVLFVNPGSAGPRRFSLPVSVAELVVDGGAVSARLVELAVAPATRNGRAP